MGLMGRWCTEDPFCRMNNENVYELQLLKMCCGVSSYMICSYSWLSFFLPVALSQSKTVSAQCWWVPIGELCTESCFVWLLPCSFSVSAVTVAVPLCFCGAVVSGFQWNSLYFLGAGSRPPQYVI